MNATMKMGMLHDAPMSGVAYPEDGALMQDGQPIYGRWPKPPKQVNYQAFDHLTPFGQPASRLRRYLGFKQFRFVSLNSDDFMIGMALVDLAWAGHGFLYLYDHRTGQRLSVSHTRAWAYQTRLNPSPYYGTSDFRSEKLTLEINQRQAKRRVRAWQGKHLCVDVTIDQRACQPLALCSPTGATGWTYTQKSTGLPMVGMVDWGRYQLDLGQSDWSAATDDSCGVLRHETAWHWLSLSTVLPDGRRLGLNLASGVNDSFGTENTLWIDGVPMELPPVLFTRLDAENWQIRSADGCLNLTVHTYSCQQDSTNAWLVANRFRQWVGLISGDLRLPNRQVVSWHAKLGLLEQHYARW
ncbi:MAG: DUF2804 domain-containing protein [Pseudomonadota bacterium]|nr:DUF2804 domain-containing protein [Pseudomonadota bacterium]